MTDRDVLARAAQALRAAHPGEHQGSGFTRARIMTSLHRSRRGRLYRWAIGAPIASLLLVGSAWAQSSGSWPAVWAAVSAVFSAEPEPSEPAGGTRRSREPRLESSERAEPSPALREPEPQLMAEAAPETTPAEAPPVDRPAPPRAPAANDAPAASRRTSRASTAKPQPEASSPAATAEAVPAKPAPPPERPADPELARFRAAHELHFQASQPRRAISAYEDYLREYPRGRFVPEARYNMALDYIKLGDKARARRELAPFAEGAYGDYRKREAEQLLEALK